MLLVPPSLWTLDRFVCVSYGVGPLSRLSHLSCLSLANSLCDPFSPLALQGCPAPAPGGTEFIMVARSLVVDPRRVGRVSACSSNHFHRLLHLLQASQVRDAQLQLLWLKLF